MKKTSFIKIISFIILTAIILSIISSCSNQNVETPKILDIKIESTENGKTTYLVKFENGSISRIASDAQAPSGDKITIGENGNFYINGVDTGISSKKTPDPVTPKEKTWKTITVPQYNISSLPYDANDSRYYEDEKDLSTFKVNDIPFIYADGEKEILYITLDSFASLFNKDLADGCTSKVTKSDSSSVWSISDKNGKEIYKFTINFGDKTISVWGNTDETFRSFDSKTTLLEDVNISITELDNAGKENVYSFANYGFDCISYEGQMYVPLGLLTLQSQHEVQRKFIYSSLENILFEYEVDEQIDSSFTFGSRYGVVATIKKMMIESMKQYSVGEGLERKVNPPKYILEHTKNLVMYLMDNYYGLASVLGYKNMVDYINNTVYVDKFLSESAADRAYAYSMIFSLLNDGHTGYGGSVYLEENTGMFGTRYSQTLLGDRIITHQILGNIRKTEVLKAGDKATETDVRYSKDGKVAYFSFDSFSVGKYFGESTLPDGQKSSDTFYQFVNNLNAIKNYNKAEGAEKGTVETVIIDDSLNGGGYVAVMGKLLALMSKDNKADLFFRHDKSNTTTKYTFRVDSNKDGKYDTNDCFGQYFNFVIVTSPYSFSCGNAFPYFADKLEIARIAGYKTGGGECSVDTVVLPFGQSINHSSNFHIGWYDENTKTFTGDESGVDPSIVVDFSIYDIEKMANKMSEIFKTKQAS